MTTDDSGLGAVVAVGAALLAVPLFMMCVAMPLALLAGHGPVDPGGWGVLLALVPLAVLGSAGYLLYRGTGRSSGGEDPDDALEELRSAYARGDLSDAEFEQRRDRLGSRATPASRSEVSNDE